MKWIIDNLNWIVPGLIALAAAGFAYSSARSAKESKDSSERSAAAAEKSAKADEEQADLARTERDEAEALLRARPWAFTQLSRTKWRATNYGGTIYRVEVTAPATTIHVEAGARGLDVVQHGEYFELLVAKGQGQDGDVHISWAESEEPDAERLVQNELF